MNYFIVLCHIHSSEEDASPLEETLSKYAARYGGEWVGGGQMVGQRGATFERDSEFMFPSRAQAFAFVAEALKDFPNAHLGGHYGQDELDEAEAEDEAYSLAAASGKDTLN